MSNERTFEQASDKPYGEVLDEMDHQAKYQSATEPRALRPLEPLLPGETRSEYIASLERAKATQQLVARLKRTSKYYGQTEPGAWFDVRVVNDRWYHLRGNNNNYRLSDVVLGMRLDSGAVVNLASGKHES
jgi:hypothetical protein